jgi:hypothetical protein
VVDTRDYALSQIFIDSQIQHIPCDARQYEWRVAREYKSVSRNQTEDIMEEISEEELRKRWDSVVASLARLTFILFSSVGDPEPQDPHVFGPPGSIPFLIDVLSGLK